MKKLSRIVLDNPRHVFVIAEAGSNWKAGSYKKDLQRAKELVNIAAKVGADAIKFQTYNPNTVYVTNAGNSKYLTKVGINDDIFKIFKKHSMPYKMLKEISDYCYKKKIILRNPNSTRPWQHVLEPLSGYLLLAEKLAKNKILKVSQNWNFGPNISNCKSVKYIAKYFAKISISKTS